MTKNPGLVMVTEVEKDRGMQRQRERGGREGDRESRQTEVDRDRDRKIDTGREGTDRTRMDGRRER